MADIEITCSGGNMPAYLATPSGDGPAHTLVLLQEVYGVNRFMRQVADDWAAEGYRVIVPALYWRLGDIELDPEIDGHREQALEIRGRFDDETAMQDIDATCAFARGSASASGKVATLGYCLGGLLSHLAARQGLADAQVSYYGVGIEKHIGGAIETPLLLHIGEDDPYTPAEVRSALAKAFDGNDLVESYVYPGVGHAFARHGASADVPEARLLANERTAEFLDRHLGPKPV